jgi:hypothetical protein
MKKVAFSLLIAVCFFVILACKNETKDSAIEENQELAEAESEKSSYPEFLYVTASSGLTLREFNNLQSNKLAVMPYGTKVKIITPEKNSTMDVGGIKGGMDEVEYNHKKGFAFNGYMSKFFPPEEDIKAKNYAEELKAQFPGVNYSEITGGTASNPSTTETITLPTDQWHEAFYIAKELFNIPTSFAFPDPKGSNEEIVKENNPKKGIWSSELTIKRSNDELQKINYSYRTEGFGYTVTITKNGENMKLEKTEVAD